MNCSQCGHLLPGQARFCPSCGHKMVDDLTAPVEANANVERVPAKLSKFREIGRLLIFGLVWASFLSEAFMLVVFAMSARKLLVPLVLGFSFLGGTLLAMHTKRLGILWFFVGAIACFFIAAAVIPLFVALSK